MSKMSQLHAELTEQASELGFESLDEALMKGYDVDYEKGKLVRRGLGYSETVEYLAKEQEKAHEAWLKEKKKILDRLRKARVSNDEKKIDTALIKAIRFIEGVKSE